MIIIHTQSNSNDTETSLPTHSLCFCLASFHSCNRHSVKHHSKLILTLFKEASIMCLPCIVFFYNRIVKYMWSLSHSLGNLATEDILASAPQTYEFLISKLSVHHPLFLFPLHMSVSCLHPSQAGF